MKSRWIALLIVLAIAPGMMEFVELAVHWAKYGDVADAAGDHHDVAPLGADEHGCSGTFHLGSCGGGHAARLTETTTIETTIVSPVVHVPRVAASEPYSTRSLAPPFRPPIA